MDVNFTWVDAAMIIAIFTTIGLISEKIKYEKKNR